MPYRKYVAPPAPPPAPDPLDFMKQQPSRRPATARPHTAYGRGGSSFRVSRDQRALSTKGRLSARAAAEDTIANREREVTSLADAKGQLEIDLQALIEYTGVSVAEIANMPLIDGAVLGINTSVAPGLVSINKGTADGVKRGFTFEVYQGGTYKGRVRVVEVQGNMCVAEVVKTVDGRSISQSDSASTRI